METAPAGIRPEAVGRVLTLPAVGGLATTLLWGGHIALRASHPPGAPARLVVTGLLILAFGLYIGGLVRLSLALDEFHRRLQLLALSIAFPASLVLAFAVGFVSAENVPLGSLDLRDLPMLMILTYLVGLFVAWWRHR
jgi:hypothetical protein